MAVGADGRIQLRADEPENGLRPSVACLFRSVAKVYGQSAVGVLLTGMGKDGALELKLMKEQGAVTMAQDRDTAVVHGMPGEVIRLGGATYVLQPEKICLALSKPHHENCGERRAGNGKQTRWRLRDRWSFSRTRSSWELRKESEEPMSRADGNFLQWNGDTPRGGQPNPGRAVEPPPEDAGVCCNGGQRWKASAGRGASKQARHGHYGRGHA